MYAEIIKQKFPHDPKSELYKVPHLPAVKLGKILRKYTNIASPSDVLALHINEGLFKHQAIILTSSRCFYGEGNFSWEDVKDCQYKGDECEVFVNRKGDVFPHTFEVKNEEVAKTFQDFFQEIAYHDPTSDEWLKTNYNEEGYLQMEINWLNLRDEVMRTIDMLYDRFNDGKLSMLEYENKKEELLSRL